MWKTKYLIFFWTNISLISAEFFCDDGGRHWCGNVCVGANRNYTCSCGDKSFDVSIYGNNLVCVSDTNCFIDALGKKVKFLYSFMILLYYTSLLKDMPVAPTEQLKKSLFTIRVIVMFRMFFNHQSLV